MPIESNVVIEQIDAALSFRDDARARSNYEDLSDLRDSGLAEVVMVLSDAIRRFSPTGSTYRDGLDTLIRQNGVKSLHVQQQVVYGIAKALRRAYDLGYLRTLEELVHADLFSDFLEMADYYVKEGHKDAAAVIGGGALEESLRKLCLKNHLDTNDAKRNPKKASALNDELAKASVYGKLEQKQVTALLDLRNKAAHGDYGSYDKLQVERYLQGIRDFMLRFPA